MGNFTSATHKLPDPLPPGTANEAPTERNQSSSTASTSGRDECPVLTSSSMRFKGPVYDVYGQNINDPNRRSSNPALEVLKGTNVLDPRNNMPLEPNQLPCPGQRKQLPTERAVSSIPKGGVDGTWTFPSPQMVYNALKRKGKGDDVTEDDMEGFVAAHNSMNEMTWRYVTLFEKLHAEECNCPSLLKFQGRPHDLSPLAWLRQQLGGGAPFDRHDWVVDRCGKEVRYVIDFYFHEDKAGTNEAFEITARPALDSFEAALDRTKMAIYSKFADWGLPCPITGKPGSIGQEARSATST
ncbi:cytochrome c/c1 heme-lyase [Dunaliella salina]|uniref:Holocytochrome c-type synthase n=1 Tax=Dunaliella salina TaxID=3046 RepID=A0ABQ7GR59_DUNSA|nr:cytochrome c/c1 heme-lyase [Dunaliella salina]|eukprot:KAF5837100.1 cytochrome c/c1 heme-lyase [Dunaliella salina]